jgi:putative RecB family exonuclease
MVEQGKGLIQCFLDKVPEEQSRVIAVEQPFRLEISGLEIDVIGALDLLLQDSDGSLTIVDHKTAARAMNDKDIHGNDQMTLYQLAVKANGFEDREVLLRYDALIKTKVPKFDQYYTSRSEADEERLVLKFQNVHRAIKAGIFIPNDSSWMCSNCEYATACKSWTASEAA